MTVVDAFCGGGRFRSGDRQEADIKGSPLVLLDAAQAAREQFFEQMPKSDFDWKVRFVFNDVEPDHTAYLEEVLKGDGHDLRGDHVTLLTGEFETNLDRMIAAVRGISPRAGRSLWILDQTGWSAATLPSIARILKDLPGSEIILTLARDNLLRLAVPNPNNQDALRTLGLSETVLRELADMKDGKRTGAVAQRRLMDDIVDQTRVNEYSCFVLEPDGSRRAIVLVHLVNHERARDAMIDMQWSLDGAFYHYAGTHSRVLSYRGLRRGEDNQVLDFRFTEHERKEVREDLARHLREEIHDLPGGKNMEEVMSDYRSRTPVTAGDIRQIVARQVEAGHLDLSDDHGALLSGPSKSIIRRLERKDARRIPPTQFQAAQAVLFLLEYASSLNASGSAPVLSHRFLFS